MNLLELITKWLQEYPFVLNLIKYLAFVLLIFWTISLIRKYIQKYFPDSPNKYKTQKGIEVFGYVLIFFLTITYFTGNIQDFGLAIGLLTAGITITLQELILSMAGSFYIFLIKVYSPGDRIEINGIKGDVIDIDSIYTTLMEIGEWVSSDNYTGRIVKLSNSFVFKGPVYNYSQDFPFIWDEFNIPIHYDSDIELAKSIVTKIASETLSEYVSSSIKKWSDVVQKYYIENTDLKPTLAISITDNWVQFNLRYIVDYKSRRTIKNLLNQKIAEEIKKTNSAVKIASSSFEIISIPELKINK